MKKHTTDYYIEGNADRSCIILFSFIQAQKYMMFQPLFIVNTQYIMIDYFLSIFYAFSDWALLPLMLPSWNTSLFLICCANRRYDFLFFLRQFCLHRTDSLEWHTWNHWKQRYCKWLRTLIRIIITDFYVPRALGWQDKLVIDPPQQHWWYCLQPLLLFSLSI